MSDPLGLVPFAIAARDGVVDGWPVRQLVTAGVALLRGSAPLVRALAGKRSAILLPPSPAMFTALAASDGRGALLLDPSNGLSSPSLPGRADVGAVFTLEELQPMLAPDMPRVLLDDAPRRARYVDASRSVVIDLAMHEGLSLEGDPDANGSNEEMLLEPGASDARRSITHREVLGTARAIMSALAVDRADHVLVIRDAADARALAGGEVATLMAGARVTLGDPVAPDVDATRLDHLDISLVVARAAALEALLQAVERHPVEASLRAIACLDPKLPNAARARWLGATGRDVPWFALPAGDA